MASPAFTITTYRGAGGPEGGVAGGKGYRLRQLARARGPGRLRCPSRQRPEACGNPGRASAIVSRETYRSASNRTIPAGDSLQQWLMLRTNTGPAADHHRATTAT